MLAIWSLVPLPNIWFRTYTYEWEMKKLIGNWICVVLFFFNIFLMWTIFKVLLDLLQYCSCSIFWFFGLLTRNWTPCLLGWKGRVLTAWPPENSQLLPNCRLYYRVTLIGFYSWGIPNVIIFRLFLLGCLDSWKWLFWSTAWKGDTNWPAFWELSGEKVGFSSVISI